MISRFQSLMRKTLLRHKLQLTSGVFTVPTAALTPVCASLMLALVSACETTSPGPGTSPGNNLIAGGSGSGTTQVQPARFTPDATLELCPKMTVSNAPPAAKRNVINYQPTINVSGVNLLVAPVKSACLSSGYGMRRSGNRMKNHRGLDYHQRPAGDIYAAADGTIAQIRTGSGFGNYLVIDHGSDVYSIYAHLARYESGIVEGAAVQRGDVVGLMGNSGSSAVHLHYEIRTGNFKAKNIFLLSPVNPFARPS